jgi:hypothetical protein
MNIIRLLTASECSYEHSSLGETPSPSLASLGDSYEDLVYYEDYLVSNTPLLASRRGSFSYAFL